MTTPAIGYDSLLRSAHRYLIGSGIPDRLKEEGVLGFDDLWTDGWVFRDTPDGNPYVDPENSGKCAIVLDSTDTWSAQNRHNTSKFPRLLVTIFADPDRNSEISAPANRTPRDKARYVWEQINPLFHDAGNRIHDFAGFPIVSTLQGGGFSVQDVPNGDGMVRATCGYDLILF